MIDIEQGHRKEAELGYIAVRQAPAWCEKGELGVSKIQQHDWLNWLSTKSSTHN